MKILFVNEYFYPFDIGGAEWSTYWQAIQMNTSNCQIFVLTPNYGTKKYETIDGVRIIRFPFIKVKKLPIKTIFIKNILWYVWSALWIIWYSKKLKIDVIHVHNKHSVPGSIIAKCIVGLPVITSIRDYSSLCNYGFCIWKKEKAHNMKEFFIQEIPFYLKNYLDKKTLPIKILHITSAIVSLWQNYCLRFFIKKSDCLVYVSNHIKKIYQQNGFNKIPTSVIYNLPPNKVDLDPNTIKQINDIKKSGVNKIIIFIGKISIGKGALSFIKTANSVLSKIDDAIYVFAGQNTINQLTIKSLVEEKIAKKLLFLGKINQQQLAVWYNEVNLVVIPSIWPEPFGRIAIEAMQFSKPIIANKSGGLIETLEDYQYGNLINTNNIELFSNTIINVINNKSIHQINQSPLKENMTLGVISAQWKEIYTKYAGKK